MEKPQGEREITRKCDKSESVFRWSGSFGGCFSLKGAACQFIVWSLLASLTCFLLSVLSALYRGVRPRTLRLARHLPVRAWLGRLGLLQRWVTHLQFLFLLIYVAQVRSDWPAAPRCCHSWTPVALPFLSSKHPVWSAPQWWPKYSHSVL